MLIMKRLYDLDFLIPFLLLRAKLQGERNGLVRFQIAKILAILLVNSYERALQEQVYIYQFGPYIMRFEDALADLMKRDIIEKRTDSEGRTCLCLTNNGEKWIMSRLRDEEFERTSGLGKEIETYLFTPISDIITEIAEKSPLLVPRRRNIGGKVLLRIFDWRKACDGKIRSYHYTLLRSYYRLEEHFRREFEEACSRPEQDEGRIIDYTAIPELIASRDLFRNKKEKYTIRYLLNKNDPRSIGEDKFEGKNYIGNLWYIYSAVNIIHVLAGLAPTINEIAQICLTFYEYEMQRNLPSDELRKMREGSIRPDLTGLARFGLLNKKKIGKHYVYSIRAKKIIDSYTSDSYSVLSEEKIIQLYRESVRPRDENIAFLRENLYDKSELYGVTAAGG